MWRDETKRDEDARKARREDKKTSPSTQPQPPQRTADEIARNNEEAGWGWCNDLVKIVDYVACCCCSGCPSYDKYHDDA